MAIYHVSHTVCRVVQHSAIMYSRYKLINSVNMYVIIQCSIVIIHTLMYNDI